MTQENDEPSTSELMAETAKARTRLADDVAKLATALEPSHLKQRAVIAAERSVESVARRTLRRVASVANQLAASTRRHPFVIASLGVGVVAFVGWRAVSRRR